MIRTGLVGADKKWGQEKFPERGAVSGVESPEGATKMETQKWLRDLARRLTATWLWA